MKLLNKNKDNFLDSYAVDVVFLRQQHFAIGRLRMNSNDGVLEKPGIRRAAHDLFMRHLVVQLMAVEVSKLFVYFLS